MNQGRNDQQTKFSERMVFFGIIGCAICLILMLLL